MNKVVILEGPDGSGKTTLARELEKRGFRYVHTGVPDGDPFAHYAARLIGYLKMDKPVVLDRFHLGEHVYGPVMRDTNYMPRTALRLFERACNAYHVFRVLCLPPEQVVVQNWNSRRKDEYVQDERLIREIYRRYDAAQLTGHWFPFDYSRESAVVCASGIETQFDICPTVPFPLGMIGRLTARVLVVGEQANGSFDLPFFSLQNSSGYINRALLEAGYPESDLAFVNALTKRGAKTNLERMVSHLPHFQFAIALGRVAQQACNAAGLRNFYMKHPSCAKRFHWQKNNSYVQELRKIREENL